jgi:hypothetical protein
VSKAVAKAETTLPAPEAPSTESSALIGLIERAARDPSIDIDKMERLFQMHERVTARSSEASFNAAMAKAQAALKPVVRKLKNSQTNSMYADLAAISEAADPVIHAHGFGVICSEFKSEVEGHLGIKCEITHADGHSKVYPFNIPLDGTGLKGNANKTATHAYGSTITYGRRYAKCSVFDIATKNDMDGNTDGAKLTEEQAEVIKAKLVSSGADVEKFLGFLKAENVESIPAKDYLKALGAITHYENRQGAGK